jgi:type IV pilus assembly protein PilY1
VNTNDGILHAIDGSNGVERWSFIPSDMLARTSRLEADPALPIGPDGITPVRTYGLDGGVHLFRDTKAAQDANGNFPAYLFFGERRGGRNYYALDISNPSQPRLMWKLDGAINNLGETWSVPVATYVIDPNNNFLPRPVVIFGGGYDDNHETLTGGLQPDSSGSAAIYIVDALDGTILWKADSTNYPAMRYAIPADIRVIDLLGADDIVDRLYAADLGGQLWRFDFDYQGIATGSVPGTVAEAVVGGRIASLGGVEDTSNPAERRRFFYPPDAAILKDGGATFINLSIGSGHREFPRSDQTTQDRLYSVRDTTPFVIRPEDSFTYDAVVRPDELQGYVLSGGQITADPTLDQSKLNVGWYLQLEPGEKFLSETRTFGGQVFGVSTKSEFVSGSCPGYRLRNRLYVLNPKTGNAITNLDGILGDDPYVDLELQDSISPEPVFLFPPDEGAVDPNTGYGLRSAPTCLVGLERCPAPLFNPPTRTYWKQRGMQ